MRKLGALHPLLVLGLWLAAAFIVIGTGPAFYPPAASTVRIEAVIWKIIGASIFLGVTMIAFGGPRATSGRLGLTLGAGTLKWLAIGSIGGGLFVAVALLLLRVFTPYHLAPGAMSAAGLSISVLIYFFGALLEELAFRGYPFVRLQARYGKWAAIAAVSIAFGVLHLPGMYGMNAIKIIVLTGLCSVVYCLAFLRSGTLWTAVGLHMGMNIALHSVAGAGGGRGPSISTLVFDGPSLAFDAGFWSFVLAALLAIVGIIWWDRRNPADSRTISRIGPPKKAGGQYR